MILFLLDGETYQIASVFPQRANAPCSIASGGPLERILNDCAEPVAVEWIRGTAHLLGHRLTPSESLALAAAESGILYRVGTRGRMEGFLSIGNAARHWPFTFAQAGLLRSMAAQVLLMLDNCRLGEALAAESAELHQRDWEMEVARQVQDHIFPADRPHVPGLDYYSDWRPARGLSGDYLDYFEMPGGDLGIAVGDVAGKGLAAALLTSALHSMARALRLAQNCSLPQLVASIDEMFYEICPDNSYATLFLARYHPFHRVLHYVNAGHEPPVVLRKGQGGYRPVILESDGPVIGMLRKSVYRENVIALRPGDLIVAFTDGLCDSINARGEEWGFRRLLDTIQASSVSKAQEIVGRVLETVEDFAKGCPQYDDMTLWIGRVEDVNSAGLTPLSASELLPAVA
ncbi:MAG: PP2C family protein-serine/threonine phosphatase [Bryobacteraceae bacterium]